MSQRHKIVVLCLNAMADASANVRIRSAWAISNACSSRPEFDLQCSEMIVYDEKHTQSMTTWLGNDLVIKVAEKMLIASRDSEKVAIHAVRTLGYIVSCLAYICSHDREKEHDIAAAEALLNRSMLSISESVQGPTAKVSWNACHALSKIFQVPELPLGMCFLSENDPPDLSLVASASWAPTVFSSLCHAVLVAENFKLRISAAIALRTLDSRAMYATTYGHVTRCIVAAFDNSLKRDDGPQFRNKIQFETY